MAVHVMPQNDYIEHEFTDCPCGPDYEFIDPDTGVTYPSGPLVTHHSLDGREQRETRRVDDEMGC